MQEERQDDEGRDARDECLVLGEHSSAIPVRYCLLVSALSAVGLILLYTVASPTDGILLTRIFVWCILGMSALSAACRVEKSVVAFREVDCLLFSSTYLLGTFTQCTRMLPIDRNSIVAVGPLQAFGPRSESGERTATWALELRLSPLDLGADRRGHSFEETSNFYTWPPLGIAHNYVFFGDVRTLIRRRNISALLSASYARGAGSVPQIDLENDRAFLTRRIMDVDYRKRDEIGRHLAAYLHVPHSSHAHCSGSESLYEVQEYQSMIRASRVAWREFQAAHASTDDFVDTPADLV